MNSVVNPKHVAAAKIAREIYQTGQEETAAVEADWHFALRDTRRVIAAALRSSNYLASFDAALMKDGAHNVVFRHLLAPPLSQDQFKLLCPEWVKSTEKGKRPVKASAANNAAVLLTCRLDRSFRSWSSQNRKPTRREIRSLMLRVSPLMASQRIATANRNRLASEQERAVVRLLEEKGWRQQASRLIDTRAALPPRHFMHKTRFATSTTAHQEVDVACGLKDTYVLAMECKVTNDETNSVKRINDVIKKAKAWKEQWGNFVVTAALLQGVIAAKDVQRLEDNGVAVFWSHDLAEFDKWLENQLM